MSILQRVCLSLLINLRCTVFLNIDIILSILEMFSESDESSHDEDGGNDIIDESYTFSGHYQPVSPPTRPRYEMREID